MPFDDRSEKNLHTLTPRAEQQARVFLQKVRDAQIDARVISGTRTYAEQDALFRKGRPNNGPIVTNARGGFSNHNFAIAWDVAVFVNGKYQEDSPLYGKAGKIGRDMGLEWGGDWQSIRDEPHFQCRTGKTMADLRALVAAHGGDITSAKAALDAVVSDLPADGHDPAPATSPATPTNAEIAPVEVYLNRTKFDIKAFLAQSRTYVGVADFADYFGGDFAPQPLPKDAKQITFSLHNDIRTVALRWEDKVAYAKFADLNAVLGYTFKFDSTNRRLTLSR